MRGRSLNSSHYALRRALAQLAPGDGWLDALGDVGKVLREWRAEVYQDLGGVENLSASQKALIDLVVRERLMIESIDRYLLTMGSLVHGRQRKLFEVVVQRFRAADGYARHLDMLGLKRIARPALSLQEYLNVRAGDQESAQVDAGAPEDLGGRAPEPDQASADQGSADQAIAGAREPVEPRGLSFGARRGKPLRRKLRATDCQSVDAGKGDPDACK